jgi:hypothetical protein
MNGTQSIVLLLGIILVGAAIMELYKPQLKGLV